MSRRRPRPSECRTVQDFVRAGVLRAVQPTLDGSDYVYDGYVTISATATTAADGKYVYRRAGSVAGPVIVSGAAKTAAWRDALDGIVPGSVLHLVAGRADGTGVGANDPLTSTWVDISGEGNSGTLTTFAGTTASGWATGPDRLAFDGSSDYVALPDLSVGEDRDFTVEARIVMPENPAASAQIATEDRSTAGSSAAVLFYVTTTGTLRLGLINDAGESGTTAESTAVVTGGSVGHVAGVCTTAGTRLYVNGVASGTGVPPAAPLTLGWTTAGARRYGTTPTLTNYFTGAILELRWYPFSLAAQQVAQNYRAETAWPSVVRVVRDFVSVGDLVIPLLGDRTGFVRVA